MVHNPENNPLNQCMLLHNPINWNRILSSYTWVIQCNQVRVSCHWPGQSFHYSRPYGNCATGQLEQSQTGQVQSDSHIERKRHSPKIITSWMISCKLSMDNITVWVWLQENNHCRHIIFILVEICIFLLKIIYKS